MIRWAALAVALALTATAVLGLRAASQSGSPGGRAPTLQNGQVVVVNKRGCTPERGDLVTPLLTWTTRRSWPPVPIPFST